MATPGEPYDDLDRCMRELKARGFNAVRLEAGLNWAFSLDGKPRGPVEFGPWIAGHGWNFSSVNARGGGRHDVLERLIHLFELAQRHGVWIILTSWEYQDSSWFVADPAIRAEVFALPMEKRFMHLAEQHDRLLTLLEARKRFAEDAQEAGRRHLPLVLDEGGFFYPPRLSHFELSPAGLSLLDLFTDLAIQHDYWGYMPGTYCGPEHLIWHENPEWLRMTNERFLDS